ncbi:glycosyltransferase family 4 protein [Rhodococcoides kroppenstedtii]
MRKPRVVWLALEWPADHVHVGGVGRYLMRLADSVSQHVELTIVTLEGASRISNVNFVEVPRPGGRFGRYYRAPISARRAISGIRYDALHCHGDDWATVGLSRYIRTYYGSSLSEARSSSGARRVNHYVLGLLEHFGTRHAVRRLAIAPESMNEFRCHDLTPPLSGLTFEPDGKRTNDPSAIFIGSFEGRKRGKMVLRAVERARAALGDGIQLSVVGPSADAEHWPSWVNHVSDATDEEVDTLIRRSWVLLAPSSYEGFGIPIIEGLSRGLRVIASPNPGHCFTSGLDKSGALPLRLVSDSDFDATVLSSIASGPQLSPSEKQASASVISHLAAISDPMSIVGMYIELVKS